MLAEAIDSTFHTNKHKQFLMHNIISVLLFLPKSVTYKPQGGQPDHHLSAKWQCSEGMTDVCQNHLIPWHAVSY